MTTFSEIPVDLPNEDQVALLRSFVVEHLSPPSISLVEDAIASFGLIRQDDDITPIYEAVGRAVLNETIVTAVTNELERNFRSLEPTPQEIENVPPLVDTKEG